MSRTLIINPKNLAHKQVLGRIKGTGGAPSRIIPVETNEQDREIINRYIQQLNNTTGNFIDLSSSTEPTDEATYNLGRSDSNNSIESNIGSSQDSGSVRSQGSRIVTVFRGRAITNNNLI